MSRSSLFVIVIVYVLAVSLLPSHGFHFSRNHMAPYTVKSYRNIHIDLESHENRQFRMTASDQAPFSEPIGDTSSVSKSIPISENLPNILTISRVVMIPFFVVAHVVGQKSIATLIFIIACVTDFLDGYLARKYALSSPFGAFLDPVADKLMVTTALVLLVSLVPAWWFALPVSLILCREIAVSALREWMAERQQRSSVQVGNLGKWKTATQMVSTILLLEAAPTLVAAADTRKAFDLLKLSGMRRAMVFFVGVATLNVSAVLTVISGCQYFAAAWPTLIGKTE